MPSFSRCEAWQTSSRKLAQTEGSVARNRWPQTKTHCLPQLWRGPCLKRGGSEAWNRKSSHDSITKLVFRNGPQEEAGALDSSSVWIHGLGSLGWEQECWLSITLKVIALNSDWCPAEIWGAGNALDVHSRSYSNEGALGSCPGFEPSVPLKLPLPFPLVSPVMHVEFACISVIVAQ